MTRGRGSVRAVLALGLAVATAGTMPTAATQAASAATTAAPTTAVTTTAVTTSAPARPHVPPAPSEAEFEAALAAGDRSSTGVFAVAGQGGTWAGSVSSAASAASSSGCGRADADPVPNGKPIVVSMPPARAFTVGKIPARTWRHPPVGDPTWRLRFLGLTWMSPLAQRAAVDRQTRSLAALVDQAVAFHRQNPDPHSPKYGWDEGTAMRRLSALNCLYALTHSKRLLNGLEAQ